mgnify:CR=1 FL=1|tara:strand:+ start:242 stop:637 length:396 start_codon:yes stop_codon:yes gene_type:complete
MDLEILKFASDTSNTKDIQKCTHKAKSKNILCGDYIFIKLNLEKNFIKDVFFKTHSCIYCQASASLLLKEIKHNKLDNVVKLLKEINEFYAGKNIKIKGHLGKIFNKKNFKRRQCIHLPVKSLYKALKLKN